MEILKLKLVRFDTLLSRQSRKFPNCLCGISTRQLELLLWRAGPTNKCKIPQSSLYS